MNVTSGLQLQVTDAVLVSGCVGLVLVAGALGVRAWRRSAGRPAVLVVEVIRTTLIALVLFALLGPEWVRSQVPEERALVAVLWDDSRSMGTVDVPAGGALVSRADALAEVIGELEASDGPGADATAGHIWYIAAAVL